MTSSAQHFNEKFQQELSRLNPAQREAVEHIEGPMLVIAGPGTGKTHILAARIGNILLKTDTQPHNILCLTFTDAGAQAMRRRLLDLIGPEAHRVHIFTFHSFCNNIIQDNLERFGRHGLEPLSDLERVEIVRRIIEELPPQHPLRRGRSDLYFYERHLQSLFKNMKAENWTAAFVESKIAAYLADLPSRDSFVYQKKQGRFQKGDLKEAKLEEEKEKMERLSAAVRLFERYERFLKEFGRYDYEDMILWVLRAFHDHPLMLSRYQEQYLYFLVDEYQDTNGAQNEVLLRLTEYWDSPNVFIVGDDDQSIFEFQGARLKNISDFFHRYQPDLKVVVLSENYRSSQQILDTSGALIRGNKLRITQNLSELGIEKRLVARHSEFAGLSAPPVVAEYPDRLQEEVDIVQQIERLRNEGFPLNEVAVIFAKHRQAERLLALLEKKGIPFRTRRSTNILDLPLIQNLRLLLDYLYLESQKPFSGEPWLFKILHFDFLGAQPLDIAKLAFHLAQPANTGMAWRTAIGDQQLLGEAGLRAPAPFGQVAAFLENMLAAHANLSLPAFIERCINLSGLLRHLLAQPENTWALEVLFAFSSFVKNEAGRNPRLTLSRLLEIFRSMDANRISLEVGNAQGTAQPDQQRVNLLTAHGAKGLEFQKVFLIDCVKDHWEPNARSGNFGFPLPDTLSLSGEEDSMESRRRLFYVGMTRAKEALQISYAASGDDGKALTRAIFLDEITVQSEGMPIQARGASQTAVASAQASLMLDTKQMTTPHDHFLVASLLEGFTLSVSSLNKYLRCPLSFYYENVLRVPVLASEAAWFGIAMHDALRWGFEKMLRMPPEVRQFPFPGEFVQFFEREMQRRQVFFGKREFERRLDIGRQALHAYVSQQATRWPKNVHVEQELRNVTVQGVPITGIIDRIDLLDNLEAHIVDYKTGQQEAGKLKRPVFGADPKTASPVARYGGSYWRQLVFYKILFDNWRLNPRRAVSAEISYLEPNGKGSFEQRHLAFEPDDVAFVTNLIVETYGKIMRHEFFDGCGGSDCAWCSFFKRQSNVLSFAEPEIEELDD